MQELQEQLRDQWNRLVGESPAGDAPLPPALGRVILRVFRGMAMGDAIALHGPEEIVAHIPPTQQLLAGRLVVIDALAAAVDAAHLTAPPTRA
jgi:hypothetical protein